MYTGNDRPPPETKEDISIRNWAYPNDPDNLRGMNSLKNSGLGASSLLGSFGRLMALGRSGGGGTGGGSMNTEGNMDPNLLIGLNPYLDQNVTSFNYGGKYKTPNYNNGGQVPAAGQYEQQANQMMALGQLSNVFKGLQQGSMLAPQANKGMKIPRYNEGGMTDAEVFQAEYGGGPLKGLLGDYRGQRYAQHFLDKPGGVPLPPINQSNQITTNQLNNVALGIDQRKQQGMLGLVYDHGGKHKRRRYTQGGIF